MLFNVRSNFERHAQDFVLRGFILLYDQAFGVIKCLGPMNVSVKC